MESKAYGFAVRSGWIESGEGFLVLDKNENADGVIVAFGLLGIGEERSRDRGICFG